MNKLSTQGDQATIVMGHDMRRLNVPGSKKTGKSFASRGKRDIFGAPVALDDLYRLSVPWVIEEVNGEIFGECESEWGPQSRGPGFPMNEDQWWIR